MNFWKVMQYFWTLWFVIFALMFIISLDFANLWRMGFTVIMIIVFAVASAIHKGMKFRFKL